MRPGTPGFIGARLKAAREARGIMTAAELAKRVGVTRAAISQYERGDQSPSPDVLASISDVLKLPSQHFLQTGCSSVEPVFFRSLSTATKTVRRQTERRYEWLRAVCHFLQTRLKFPVVDFPILSRANDPALISSDDIEEAATQARRHWGLSEGPISNAAWLLENKGAIVVRADLGTNDLDAFSQWPLEDDRPYIILGTNKGGVTRSRFNALHEVAHMLLHRSITAESLAVPGRFQLMEQQAHRFAAAFLLPAEAFRRDVPFVSLDALKNLKPHWRASISTMLHRLVELGAVNSADARRHWINLSRRGWRTHEPFDDTIEGEEPRFLRRCFELLLKNGVKPADVALGTRLQVRDIEELANLPIGMLATAQVDAPVHEAEPTLLGDQDPSELNAG